MIPDVPDVHTTGVKSLSLNKLYQNFARCTRVSLWEKSVFRKYRGETTMITHWSVAETKNFQWKRKFFNFSWDKLTNYQDIQEQISTAAAFLCQRIEKWVAKNLQMSNEILKIRSVSLMKVASTSASFMTAACTAASRLLAI